MNNSKSKLNEKHSSADGLTSSKLSNLKSNIVEKALFDNVLKLTEFNLSKKDRLFLDDSQLKKLNSILSNIPFNLIKQEYDRFSTETYLNSSTPKGGSSSKSDKHQHQKRKNGNSKSLRRQANANKLSSTSKTSIKSTAHEGKSRRLSIGSAASMRSGQDPVNINSNQITIHVCDESKRLKQDFTCPKDLLVKEMKYFNNNLTLSGSANNTNKTSSHAYSTASAGTLAKKSLDEIDISVHCDINIFDWLMRYVKRHYPHLIEKNITTPTNKNLNETQNKIIYASDGQTPVYVEPLLDSNNAVSILLSSDFLIMHELVDKCVLFIAKNLENILLVPCVLNNMNENLSNKIAACVAISRLHDLVDKKDKIKSRLFQRKIEFMFNVEKLKNIFNNSVILNEFKATTTGSEDEQDQQVDDQVFINRLYEFENDASTLFKCKICSRFMTKTQSLKLTCNIFLVDKHGQYVYLHVPDDKYDLTAFLRLLKDKLKSWQWVYWFIWCLIKTFKCKKCHKWFRLVDMNKCRLNDYTHCTLHDLSKINLNVTNDTTSNSTSNNCTCLYCEHVTDETSAYEFFSNSQILTFSSTNKSDSAEAKLDKYIKLTLEMFNRVKDNVLGTNSSESNEHGVHSLCDWVENTVRGANTVITKNPKSARNEAPTIESCFVDSISGKHMALVGKNQFNMIKVCQSLSGDASNFDLKAYLSMISQLDPLNVFNSLGIFNWLRVDSKMKWDMAKPIRLNQDNQREDDLKRLREISNYLIKTKLIEENSKPSHQRSPIAAALSTVSNASNLNTHIGGMYCRIESEWKK